MADQGNGEFSRDKLIYDWNTKAEKQYFKPGFRPLLVDETLRDGFQSPSIKNPTVEEKLQLIHLIDELGIPYADIGIPSARGRWYEDTYRVAKEIADSRLRVVPNCAGRTVTADIDVVLEISQRAGIPLEPSVFLGSSPIRMYAEGWTLDRMLKLTEDAVRYVVDHGLPVMYVTEDTTRAHPETLRMLYTTAIEAGARRICLSDTVGHAMPDGVQTLIRYIKGVIADTGEDVRIDWHGHNDRGLGVINAMTAIIAGAERVHGCALGIGERVGNASMDQLLVNFKLLGWIDQDLHQLSEYCHLVSRACEVPIPPNYPVVGRDAFRTGTGVHAAAVIKAMRRGDVWLADAVYSGVPAGEFGLRQIIEVGPMSGESNVVWWLEQRQIAPSKELVGHLFSLAKEAERVLTEEELLASVAAWQSQTAYVQ